MTDFDLLAIGEPLIELVRLPQSEAMGEDAGRLYRSGVGGDALNALVAAARQGARTGLISTVGDDLFGRQILDFCRSEGIDVSAVATDPLNPTGFLCIDPDPADRHFFYARAGSAACHIAADRLDAKMIASARALHVTGVSLAISAAMRGAVMRAVDIARNAGVLVSFDLNFRPALWSAENALAAVDDMLPLVDIVFPSEDEVGMLTGLTDPAEMLARFRSGGARLAILKRGERGAIVSSDAGVTEVPAVPVDAVDSSGAGDSFAGAFLAHYLHGADPGEAAERAAEVAAATVTGLGATDAIPRSDVPPGPR